jgi:hypothetical protein
MTQRGGLPGMPVLHEGVCAVVGGRGEHGAHDAVPC